MATIPNLITGDDITFPVELTKKAYNATVSTTFVIDPGAILKARLVYPDRESILTAEITQNLLATGADLANSLVIIEFASADTIGITYQGSAYLEIQLNDGGKLTWFVPVRLTRGQID